MSAMVPRVLSIAGSDSGGGAGIQADLKTCLACGVFGMTAIVALTAQNTVGVQAIEGVPLPFITQQIDSTLGDIGADAIKTGMLATSEVITTVVNALRSHEVTTVVVDPVMVAANGDPLLQPDAIETMKTELLPMATVLTPNVYEAALLLGGAPITSHEEMEAACRALHALGPRAVLLKGGSKWRGGTAEGGDGSCYDLYYDGSGDVERLSSPMVDTRNTHGTGCTLSSAVAANLAKGLEAREAVVAARNYVYTALLKSAPLKVGQGAHGPLNHGHAIEGADWAAAGDEAQVVAGAEGDRKASTRPW